MTESHRLQGRVIIVTGSTTGIGRAIAEQCVAEGAHVVIHGLEEEMGCDVVEKLGADRARLCVADLVDPASPALLVEAATEAFGRIDGIVNNAAITARSTIESTDIEFFDGMMAANARAPLYLIKAAMSQLEANRGVVVNIGSINAHCGLTKLLDYSMSKAANMTMTRNLANSLNQKGIRINHLNPGWVLSEQEYQKVIDDGQEPGWPDRLPKAEIPFGAMTSPEQIAEHAVFWLSDDSFPITGAVTDLCQYTLLGRIPEDLH